KENHDQFVQRASGVFHSESVRSWTRIERAVFNHLMGRLIRRHSYQEISNEMLYACQEDMNDVVQRLKGC
ncbi:MAG: hypothetical protein H6R16_2750, partial [Proteobacteria bacterium]|nr:hypothetical protein [Pseudomonadota bacterium]